MTTSQILRAGCPPLLRGYDLERIDSRYKVRVSDILNFLFCQRCAYRSIVYKLRTEPDKNSRRGLVIHKLWGLLKSEEESILEYCHLMDSNSLMQVYLEHAQTILDSVRYSIDLNDDEWNNIMKHVMPSIRCWASDFCSEVKMAKNILPVRKERQFEVYYSAPDLAIAGARIDMIEGMVPVEFKTSLGPRFGVYDSNAIQLTWYALLMEKKHAIDVNVGEVHYMHRRRVVKISAKLRLEALHHRDALLAMLEEGTEPSSCSATCTKYRNAFNKIHWCSWQ